MAETSGTISKIYGNKVNTPYGEKTAYAYVIEGQRYSGGFKRWSGNEGDEVTIDYEVNAKGYNDIKKMFVTGKGSVETTKGEVKVMNKREFPVPPLAPERTINRQNALTAAAKLFGEHGIDNADLESLAEDIIKVARMFENYTTGDADLELAKAEMKSKSK